MTSIAATSFSNEVLLAGEENSEGADASTSWPMLRAAGRVTRVRAHLEGEIARSKEQGTELPKLEGRYRLQGALGRGTFGLVMAGEDAYLSRPVAIKLVPLAKVDSALAERVLREGRALALLDHPSVVRVYDVGVTKLQSAKGAYPVLFIVMERLVGESLREWMSREQPLEARLSQLAALARGMEVVHRAGLVHRDIKPENTFVTQSGRLVLVDFGLARAAAELDLLAPEDADFPDTSEARQRLGQYRTQHAGPVGTPAYMAPEVRVGWEATPASDQWSWAAMAWEMLTGRRPEVTPTKVKLPRWWRIPGALRESLTKALRSMPDERHGGVGVLAAELEAWSPGRLARAQTRWRAVKRLGIAVVLVASVPVWGPVVQRGLAWLEATVRGLWGGT